METAELLKRSLWKPLLVVASLAFMYWTVFSKLAYDWWNDDNYSHGLLVPFVVACIVWLNRDQIRRSVTGGRTFAGLLLIFAATALLIGGILGAVLVAQRASLIVMIIGIIVFFFGSRVLWRLTIPLLLVLLAIPIPQLIFNKIAFPLQLLASRLADRGIGFLGIPADRYGNVIDIHSLAANEIISLEVVEACSGIRSLMTLITLALLLGYFTRERHGRGLSDLRQFIFDRDVYRTILLMAAAVPVAILTNAGRVIGTGIVAYYYGRAPVETVWHDISGSLVFVTALALLYGLNLVLKWILRRKAPAAIMPLHGLGGDSQRTVGWRRIAFIIVSIALCGSVVNWFQNRGEITVDRRLLAELPSRLGQWEQRNDDIRFDPDTEKVLRATDYVMRDYYGPGKRLNVYIGYYASQRSGATYHSPLSCLPGTGWEMLEPELLVVTTASGRRLEVKRMIVQQGDHREYLIYWYQGRGRVNSSEYVDRLFTSFDSLTRRRSDGGMVRIMTPLGKDPARSLDAAIDLTGHLADNIGHFLPD